mgnify:CR=1 FL=1
MSSNLDSLSDEALAQKARCGDRAAFEVLCTRHLPIVYNRLRALVPPDAVEDITQEVFIAAMHAVRRFHGRSTFRTWLSAITRHKVADFYRQRSRRPETTPIDDELQQSNGQSWEEHAAVRIALSRLPEHYQEIILLRFAEGMPFQEIADVLGISLEATKSRYRRAIAAIAEELRR